MNPGTEVGSYKDTSAGNSDAEAAGIKTNILTWNKTTDQNGNALSKANQGMVSKLLTSVSENMKDFSDNIRAFAIALAITFGAVGMMNMIQDKNASNEALSREFIKLMIGVWFIYNYKFFALLIIRGRNPASGRCHDRCTWFIRQRSRICHHQKFSDRMRQRQRHGNYIQMVRRYWSGAL